MADVCIISCMPGTGKSGMPSKTWTIMAAGTTIVASFDLQSEMDKTIQEAKCGYCVESEHAEELVEGIVKLQKNPKLLKEMGQNARKYAESHISKNLSVAKYIKTIENTVN